MPSVLHKSIREKLFAKVFFRYTIVISLLSVIPLILLYYSQGQALKNHLIEDGKMLSTILSYNSRVGIFTGEKNDFRNAVEGTFQNKDVLSISISSFTDSEKLEWQRDEEGSGFKEKKVEMPGKNISRMHKTKVPFVIEKEESIEFWSPVSLPEAYKDETRLFYPEDFSQEIRVVGFAAVSLSKMSLNGKLQDLLYRYVGIGIFLVLSGVFMDYMRSKRSKGGQESATQKAVVQSIDKKFGNHRQMELFNQPVLFREISSGTLNKKKNTDVQLLHFHKMATIGELAGGMAHNFKNILNTAQYNIMALQYETDETLSREVLKNMLSLLQRGANLVDDLKNFSVKKKLNEKPLNINEVINEAEMLLEIFLSKKIQIKKRLPGEPVMIMADHAQIEQILINLVSNAKDAILPGAGTIHIETRIVLLEAGFFNNRRLGKPGRYALISVSDTGRGIEKDKRDKIFNSYYTTKNEKGMGLGLSTILWTLHQYRGFIEVESEVNKGSLFKVYLPLLE